MRRMHPFILQTVEEALCGSVVPTIALAAHRAAHAVCGRLALEIMANVLAAPVRMM